MAAQRLFSQKLTGSQNADVKRTVSFQTKSGSISGCSSSVQIFLPLSLNDMVDPPDWEELSARIITDRDPLAYPSNDLDVSIVNRKIRTIKHVMPDEDLCDLSLHVRECIRCYTSDWVAVDYHHRSFSGSFCSRDKSHDRNSMLQTIPKQEYEIDIEPPNISTPSDELTVQGYSQPSSGRQSVASLSSTSSCNDTLTPRGSWASLDLRSSSSDPLLPDLLERRLPEQLDQLNETKRMEGRKSGLLGLFASYSDDDEAIEKRLQAEPPCEIMGHRILVKCIDLKLEPEVEPIFASLALYDAKERKKVSENFYFDMNSDGIKKMLSLHVSHYDLSTLSRSAVFDITHPTSDLFLVLRLEKVLQGDISECTEPYINDKNREKLRSGALAACERLGKYRMPFAWTAISIMNIISGSHSLERDSTISSDKDSIASASQSNSLDRKSSAGSLEHFKRQGAGGSLTRRGSLERRSHIQHSILSTGSDDLRHSLETFEPKKITVRNFFKQESDKLRDEDLYKFLLDLKRTNAALKKLKSIPGVLTLDISPCPEELKNGLTPELSKLNPYSDDNSWPYKEIVSFPLFPISLPHYQYRNLLYIYPKDLNFASFSSRIGSARNIAVRVQLMAGEDQSKALNAIFGRSSCSEFVSEAFSTVTYHNKCPSFYDEIKIKLPANLSDEHHLLFTFYHISCQKKPVTAPELEKAVETPVGFTWLPLLRSGLLSSGEHSLPVMIEQPPSNYHYIFPNVLLPGTKWIDNHKDIFTISLEPLSSVHSMDSKIEEFLKACEAVQCGIIPPRIGLCNMEAELRTRIIDLPNAKIEPLVKILPVILDKLILLLVMAPSLNGHQLNIGHDVFCCITQIFTNITNMNENMTCDFHGRSSLLSSYVQFQCLIPRPHKSVTAGPSHATGEVFDWCSNVSGSGNTVNSSSCKVLHEELSLQWVLSTGTTKDLAMQNSWTLFELMVKSMVEHLWWNATLDAPRKTRFADPYIEDITNLVNNIISEILNRYSRDGRLAQSLNNSLAFFLFDLLNIMDRGFVFILIKAYYKQISAKICSSPEAMPLIQYKIAFLRIICSHEHFISLNLPYGTPYTSPISPSSPSPSTHSSHSAHSAHSHSSNVSYQLSSGDKGCFAELSPEFRHQHFLVGLLLAELTSVLDIQNPPVQSKAICAVLSLLTSHDSDTRFAQPEIKARVAALYIPLLAIVMDVYPQLNKGFLQNKERLQLGEDYNSNTPYSGLMTSDAHEFKKTVRVNLNSESTKNLLLCFVWVLKSVDKAAITKWCSELAPSRIYTLLQVLSLCFACFEYKGKKEIQSSVTPVFRKTSDIKSRLEDVILGQGSARNEMIMRRKGCTNSMSGGNRERWRKELTRASSAAASFALPGPVTPFNSSALVPPTQLEGALASDISLTVLHTLETIVQVASAWDSHHSIFGLILRVLLLGLGKNQSTNVLQHMFATQRSLVSKFHWLVFDSETEQCGELCLVLLRHCGALCGTVRSHAAVTLYLLMRQNYEIGNNFARVKMQVTMSLSSLVGTSATFSEDSLRRALKTILLYAEQDTDLQDTSFPDQVKDLVINLHMILSDTVKMKEFQEDPEMLLDLMHRIAKGYQNSPDLRLTWLANMAQKHMDRNNDTEAGMCLVHSAALVAEYLVLLGNGSGVIQGGAVALQHVTPNALQESAVSDDVMAPRNEGICLGKDFTEQGLQGLLDHAASSFQAAGMYEAMNDVYKVLIPIAETNKDYKKLANVHGKLHEAYNRIEQLSGKRVFGTYFRVGFYGSKFGDLNAEEFIYKEPTLTKLPEIFGRLENFYGQRFGSENIVIIKDSNMVDTATLDPEKAYIQITYVEPYFEPYELRYKTTHFEKNFNIKRFIYATPFTTSGRAHGELSEQYKRKTILTVAHHFPYVKTRIHVVHRSEVVLSPIEVAIEDIQKKINELGAATNQEPPDTKMLQMVVQGCIGTTVNQGPMEMALVFLSGVADGTQPPTRLTHKLRLCFKDFSKKCADALKKNKNLIGLDQREYQKELERNYLRFKERLTPLIETTPSHVAQLYNGNAMTKAERRYHT